ncbi:MAG: MerR family transcriptional regulator [Lachnospiraceae bacterium]|nr:MerR family transcriptional regulator [Lachnospiraceae bacterium]
MYRIKDLKDKLGVSRKSIIVYEKEGLLIRKRGSLSADERDHSYREFTEEEVDRIWTIKFFQELGYSISEIKEILDNPNTDLYKSVTDKIGEMEKELELLKRNLAFAKMIRMFGVFPGQERIDNHSVTEFANIARDQWLKIEINNICIEEYMDYTKYMENVDDKKELKKIIRERIPKRLQPGIEMLMLNGEVLLDDLIELSKMSLIDYKSKETQCYVEEIYSFMRKHNSCNSTVSRASFAEYLIIMIISGGDFSKSVREKLGEDKMMSIVESLAFFGGFEDLEGFKKYWNGKSEKYYNM